MWVDTHAHLQLAERPAEELILRAPAVDWLVVPGTDRDSSIEALALQEAHPGKVLATAGLHPHDAARWREQEADLAALAIGAAAVGETGLDFYRDLSPRSEQVAAFRAHTELARELRKPLIVHCRDAFESVYEVLADLGADSRTILHCWTGGPRWTRRFLDLGVTFSFAGPITFEKGDTVRRAAGLVPPGSAVVETDTPFLAPPPFRNQENEPANVAAVGEALALVWGMTAEQVARITSETAAAVFRR